MLTHKDLKKIALFREKYDQICPIGEWCGTALWMRKQGLRNASLPLDWIGLVNIVGFVDIICNDFKGFLQKENLKLLESSDDPVFGSMNYVDLSTGMHVYHDFPVGVPFEQAYPVVWQRFSRRIERMYQRIGSSKKTLFIHFARERPTDAKTVLECAKRLRDKFPGKNPNLLVIENLKESCEETVETLAPGVVRICGNFFCPGDDSRYGNKAMGCEIFGSIRFKGRLYQLAHRKIQRLIFHLVTNCHLTHARRDAARTKLRIHMFNGDN